MIFGALLGVIGAIIAVPIIASIQIVVIELTTERRARMAALRSTGRSACRRRLTCRRAAIGSAVQPIAQRRGGAP